MMARACRKTTHRRLFGSAKPLTRGMRSRWEHLAVCIEMAAVCRRTMDKPLCGFERLPTEETPTHRNPST